jgi:hypothetical protein
MLRDLKKYCDIDVPSAAIDKVSCRHRQWRRVTTAFLESL